MSLKQTATREQIKKAKKRAGKATRQVLRFNSFKQLAPLAFIYNR